MKRNKFFLILFFFTLLTTSVIYGQNVLSGHVIDKETGEVLPGATVFVPDLKAGTSTDKDGKYTFRNLPGSSLVIQVSHIGYKAEIVTLDLSKTHTRDFQLIPSAIEVKEIVVTGNALSSDNDRSSFSITPISKNQLLTVPSTNLINSISTVPGVSEITTGGEISKPVIRGLGYNRIVTLNEGVRQEGNQWGDEHGIEIDQFSADRIEVLKGPASLFYGSDAMGGVINILEQTPAKMGSIDGEWISQFSTNDRLFSNSAMVEGNQNGWIWRARGTYKTAASYHTPMEWVYNSGFNEKNFSLMAGVIKKWGYSHLHFSSFNTKIGMVDGTRDSTTNQFIDYQGNIVSEEHAKRRSIDVPFQEVSHNKISSVTNLLIKDNQLKISLGYQWNNRKEFGETPDNPGLFFHLDTWTYDVRYTRLLGKSLELVGGVSGMTQINRNKGIEFLIPDYDLQDWGGFVYAKKTWERFTFNMGLRYDSRQVKAYSLYLDTLGNPALSGDTLFRSFSRDFSAFTGSTGMTFKLNKEIHFKFNVGRGFRAPNISELSANGLHEGTFRYEIGNPGLNPETSLQIDGEISWDNKYLSMVFNGFYNIINNFIYYRNINGEEKEVNGVWYPVYRYVQGNSLLKGFEFELDVHPVDALHFDNNIDYVWGENLSMGAALPFIPALHLTDQVKWTFKTRKTSAIKNPYIQLELETHFYQGRVDVFETVTPGYVLLNCSIGSKLKVQKQLWTWYISGTNLLDTKYYDHLSRLKEVGIYNMGRRITLGLVIPFGLYHSDKD
ncbi:MAG: TonB-dependent receptor [Bacteroidales bacterium]|nr:TonB-dependent receptor [Bacteroidales bacterium]